MVLVVDIGNTNITCGIFSGDDLVNVFRMTTYAQRTSDEYGVFLKGFIAECNYKITDVEGVIIATVVPNVMYSFVNAIKKCFGKEPIVVGPGTKTGVRIMADNPKDAGADLIVNAAAVKELYPGPSIVIDFGTATTYQLVLEDGTLDAAVIVPGIKISAAALFQGTARLPEIDIKKPKTILAKDTVTSIQAGVFYSAIGTTEYIVKKMKEEYGREDVKVIATGGLGATIAGQCDIIDVYDNILTLKGLNIIFKKNAG